MLLEIPEDMKKHNGIFFEDAKSGDPTRKIPGCEKLIENLIAAMKMTEHTEHDEMLKKCTVWINRAHYHYYEEGNIRMAMEYCNAIMREITPLCYNKRYVIASPKSFSTVVMQSV